MDEPFIVRDGVESTPARSASGAAGVGLLFNHDDETSERIVLFDDPIASSNTVNTSLYTPISEQRTFYPWGVGGGGNDDNDNNNRNNADDRGWLPNNSSSTRGRCFSTSSRTSAQTELVGLNYLNLVSYLAGQVLITVGIGLWDFNEADWVTKHIGITTTWDFLQRYDTLLKPYFWTYEYLFCVIILWQGIFVLCQLFKYYSSRPIIQEEIGFLYFYLCICQAFYTVFCSTHHIFGFYYLSIVGSFLSILGIFLCLLAVLVRFHKRNNARRTETTENTIRNVRSTKRQEYWLFRFPFLLYMGWTIPMLLLHFTILFRILDGDDKNSDDSSIQYNYISLQLSSNIVSIALLFMMACLFILFGGPPFGKTDITIPFVILHFFLGIGFRLHFDPSQDLIQMYGTIVINSMRDTIWILSGLVLSMIIPRFIIFTYHEFCTIHLVSLNEEEEELEMNDEEHNFHVFLNE